MSGLLLLVPLDLCLPVIEFTLILLFTFHSTPKVCRFQWYGGFGRSRTHALKSVVLCAIHYTTKPIVVPTGLEPILFWTKTRRVANYTMGQYYAEDVGFEPTVPCGTTVFKTAAFDHSANLPFFNMFQYTNNIL